LTQGAEPRLWFSLFFWGNAKVPMMRVAVYTIALNNYPDVREWTKATVDADYRLILDLGSTDETDRYLEQLGCTVHRIQTPHMRSDDAINAALALLPPNFDVCFRVDMHERPRTGWFAAILRDFEVDQPVLNVLVSASPSKRYYEPRIHNRVGFRWSGPRREVLMWRGNVAIRAQPSEVTIDRRDEFPASDLPLLKEGVDEAPSASRVFRYAEILLMHGHLQDGLLEIQRHIALGGPPHETAYLWRLAALVDEASAPQWLTEAQNIYSCASNYLGFAEYHFRNRDWGQAYLSCQYALSLLRSNPQKVLLYTDDARLRESTLHDIATVAALNLWNFEAAYGHAVEALRRAPNNPVMLKQMKDIQAQIATGATLDPDMVNNAPAAAETVAPPAITVQVVRKGSAPDLITPVSPQKHWRPCRHDD
jgi:tetratricopeptide (TPR) repeat protein